MWRLHVRWSPVPAGSLPGCSDLRSVTFCSADDKAAIIRDDRRFKKKKKIRQNVSVIYIQCVLCGVNNSNESKLCCA